MKIVLKLDVEKVSISVLFRIWSNNCEKGDVPKYSKSQLGSAWDLIKKELDRRRNKK